MTQIVFVSLLYKLGMKWMPTYFALSNYMTQIVLVFLYINHRDLRFLLFSTCNINVAIHV